MTRFWKQLLKIFTNNYFGKYPIGSPSVSNTANRALTGANLRDTQFGNNLHGRGLYDFSQPGSHQVVNIGQLPSCGSCLKNSSQMIGELNASNMNVSQMYISKNAQTIQIIEPITPEMSRKLNERLGNKTDYTGQVLVTKLDEHGNPLEQKRYYLGTKKNEEVWKPAKTQREKIIETNNTTNLNLCGIKAGGVFG